MLAHTRRHPPRALGRIRSFRAARPAEIGPFIAGIGAAAVIYGTSLLLKAASNPKFQEAMREGASKTAKAASAAASRARTDTSASPRSSSSSSASASSYFTTDVMGLDLGQGYKEWSAAVAAVVEGGEARVVENDQGTRTTPAVVAFLDNGETLVGLPAKKLIFSRTATPVYGMQLLFGLPYASDECQEIRNTKALRYTICSGENNYAAIDVHGAQYMPSEIAGRIMSKLKESAETAAGRRGILSAVAGIRPAASEMECDAMISAGQRAGLELELVPEPVLAAMGAANELQELSSANQIGVYFLGGQSFSFSIIQRTNESSVAHDDRPLDWKVVASRFLPTVGGEGIDQAIVSHLVDSFKKAHGIDLSMDHLALQRLHDAAEAAKAELCSSFSTEIKLPFISASAEGPLHLDLSMSRQALSQLVEPLLNQTLPEVDAALEAATLRSSQLDAVLLVGGSARAPAVHDVVHRHIGRLPLRTLRPEEDIAKGAAVRAQQLQSLQFGS